MHDAIPGAPSPLSAPPPPQESRTRSGALGAGPGALRPPLQPEKALSIPFPRGGPLSQLLALCVYIKQAVSTWERQCLLGADGAYRPSTA